MSVEQLSRPPGGTIHLKLAPHFRVSRLHAAVGLLGLSIAFTLGLTLRIDSPLVIYDELAYLLLATEFPNFALVRELAPSVPQLSNFLYLGALKLLHLVAVPTDIGAKMMNVICLGLGNFLLVRRIILEDARRSTILPIALICVFPTITYSAYVMPEAAYFLGFVLVCSPMFKDFDPSSPKFIISSALGLAALTLLKAHGVILLGALIGALVLYCGFFDRKRYVHYILSIVTLLAIFFACVFIFKSIVLPADSGTGGVIGNFYAGMLGEVLLSRQRLSNVIWLYLLYFVFFSVLAAPILVSCVDAIVCRRYVATKLGHRHLVFLALFLLTSVILVLGVVSYVLSAFPDEFNRVHLRYINFVFPVLVAFVWIARSQAPRERPAVGIVAGMLWLTAISAMHFILPQYRALAVDSPELFAFYRQAEFGKFAPTWLRFALTGLFGIAAAALIWKPKYIIEIQLSALLIASVTALWNVTAAQASMSNANYVSGFRHIGDVARLVCGSGRNDIIAIGSTEAFVPLGYALYRVGRAVRFEITSPAQVAEAVERVPASVCLLTTHELQSGRGRQLFAVPAIWLYRLGER